MFNSTFKLVRGVPGAGSSHLPPSLTVAVIGLLGTMTIRDRDSGRSEAPSGSPAASAQTRDLTPAELNEMWAAADAGFAGVELPAASAQTRDLTPAELSEMWAAADAGFAGVELSAAVVQVPAPAAAEPDPALWAIVDHVTLTGS